MPDKLYIELSSACNLHCVMCFRNSWFGETPGLMSKENVERLRKYIGHGNVNTVFFGGMGEPLMHPELCSLIRTASLAGKKTELLTNGVLLSEAMCRELASSSLSRLWVSADGFRKESYERVRKGSLFRLLRENLSRFKELCGGISLGFTFVITRENEEELNRINAFADEFGADELNLSFAIPGKALKEDEALYDRGYEIGKMRRFPGFGSVPSPCRRKEDYCPFIGEGAVFVRFDGEVCPCMQLLHSSYTYLYTEKRKVYAHSFGNIKDKSIDEIWNSPEYSDFRKRVEDFDFPCCTVCLGCEDRLENRKDCMYNTAPTCGACLWAQGIARCP